jgi:tRNA threonylcarbamoyladenosine modification (KEOPS) complex Cgi121 subunit
VSGGGEKLVAVKMKVASNTRTGFTWKLLDELTSISPTVEALSLNEELGLGLIFEAGRQTIFSAKRGILLARKQHIDFLLRLKGTSQISKAVSVRPKVGEEEFWVAGVVRRADISALEEVLNSHGFRTTAKTVSTDSSKEKKWRELFQSEASALISIGKSMT